MNHWKIVENAKNYYWNGYLVEEEDSDYNTICWVNELKEAIDLIADQQKMLKKANDRIAQLERAVDTADLRQAVSEMNEEESDEP